MAVRRIGEVQLGAPTRLAHLKQQLKDALSSIELGDDKANAPEAPRLVRDALDADAKLPSTE